MQFYTVSQQSLAKSGSSVVEEYIPLWFSDGTTVSSNSPTFYLIGDGANSTYSQTSGSSPVKLFTVNSNWNPSQKYAFEATIYSSSSSYTAYASLFDVTTSTATQVSGTAVNTTNTTMTVIRSGQFTLTPGHIYGVGIANSPSGITYICDASLVVFGQ